MIVQNLLLSSESYTYPGWGYRGISTDFSRMYYVLDGEAYYEENGERVRLKKNHLYLTPVRTKFGLNENPENKLLHTYVHIITIPAIRHFAEIEVREGTPLADGVALWRKYAKSGDEKLILRTVQFVVSCVEEALAQESSVAERIRRYIERFEGYDFDMEVMSRELGYCREYMTRQFHLEYHVTPKQYFHQRKMNVALERLLQGARIKEIAEELNYSSGYAFSKAFKKHFGASPENYYHTLKG